MHSKPMLLLIAVLALAAVACESDNPPQPIVEGPSLDADRGAPTVTVRPPAPEHVTPREVAPANLAPAPPVRPRLPVTAGSPSAPSSPAVAPVPAVPPTTPVQHHAHAPVESHAQAGNSGVGGVVNRVTSPLP